MAAYKTIHQHKTHSDDPFKLVVDPTIYTGSGGVVLALQKVSQFLKHENQRKVGEENIDFDGDEESKDPTPKSVPTPTPTPTSGFDYDTIREKYEEALEYNLNLVKKDKQGKFENNCSAYF